MHRFYRRYLTTKKSKHESYLLNKSRKAKRLKSAIGNLRRSYWKTVKNANLNDLFNLGILSSNRIKFKEFPILLLLVIYECVQLSFRNNLPYVVFIVIILQSAVYLKNTTELFDNHLEYLHFKSTPILSLGDLLKTKPFSSHFISLVVLNNLVHLTDLHIYISLINFLWKGSQLESIFGRIKFTFILIAFTLIINLTFLALNFSFYFCTLNDYFLKNRLCGFTPVTFALKVCCICYEKEFRLKTNKNLRLSNEQIRTRSEENLIKEIILEACVVQTPIWFEFLCLLAILPKITILNHLSGIVVGLMYTKTKLLKNLIDHLTIRLSGLLGVKEIKGSRDNVLELNRMDSPSLGKIIISNRVQLCLDQLRLKKTYFI